MSVWIIYSLLLIFFLLFLLLVLFLAHEEGQSLSSNRVSSVRVEKVSYGLLAALFALLVVLAFFTHKKA